MGRLIDRRRMIDAIVGRVRPILPGGTAEPDGWAGTARGQRWRRRKPQTGQLAMPLAGSRRRKLAQPFVEQ